MVEFTLNFDKIKNPEKHIWEGWTVIGMAREIEPSFRGLTMNNWEMSQLQTKQDFAKWIGDEQPFYKKPIKEVVDFYWPILQEIKQFLYVD